MRNNSGALKDETGRVVRFGLGNTSKQRSDQIKSSDLIGFMEVVVTPDMVGKKVAVFTAIECKAPGFEFSMSDKRAAAQLRFIDWINNHGGIAGFADSVESFKTVLARFFK